MAFSKTLRADEPMGEMNTTPLIDVMLVLLIMFVITIPVATHSLDFDQGGGVPPKAPTYTDRNLVRITPDNRILWNDAEVSDRQLAALLRQTRALPVEPEPQFRPDAAASYDTAAHTLSVIKASGVSKFGFVGNESFAEFGRAAAPPALH
ncbi:MAG: biopolymer transporter ExbD [Proteobacteria bacterium]|nr:biopolymer transporter ExbD [Pseudomonadota bacterium]